MEKIIFSLFLTASIATYADDAIVALTQFHVINGNKAFGAKWFEGQKFGIINMGLVWKAHSPEVSNGFKLGDAQAAYFVSPLLPEGCEIKSLKENLNWMESAVSTISTTLSGASCRSVIAELKTTRIEIRFSEVPHQVGNLSTKNLRLKIDDSLK